MKKALLFCFFLTAFASLRAQSSVSFQTCTKFWPTGAPVTADYIAVEVLGAATCTSENTSCVSCNVATDDFPANASISLLGQKDGNFLNGVTLLDLFAISKHILGIQPLPGPYAMIAADANRSGSITSFDMVEIQKLLMGIYDELPNNTSWRFMDALCNFPNPANPFSGAFCGPIVVDDPLELDGDTLTIIGIKIGDVDGDGDPASFFAGPPVFSSTVLEIPNPLLTAGVPTTIEIRLGGSLGLNGIQTEFLYDADVLEFNGTDATFNFPQPAGYGIFPGKIIFVGYDMDNAIQPGNLLMKFTFTANTDVHLWDVFSLNTETRHSLGVVNGAQTLAIELGAKEGLSTAVAAPAPAHRLGSPRPNPFTEQTAFPLQLEQPETVRLDIFDTQGRTLYALENTFPAGAHLLNVPQELMHAGTAAYYRLQAGNAWTGGKLVKL